MVPNFPGQLLLWDEDHAHMPSLHGGACPSSTGSVCAEWTATNAEATGAISFGGGKDAEMLNEIRGIAQAGQLSNMAAFVPTDCPTRSVH